jgi:protein-tyrosine phosphatase
MTPFAAAALREYGADPEGFTARELTTEQVADADLVLTATVDHRAQVVGLVPSAVRRTFTLREVARLGAAGVRGHDGAGPGDAAEWARAAVVEALARRGVEPRGAPGADDIDDPYGAPLQVYRERLREIAEAVDQVVAALVPS